MRRTWVMDMSDHMRQEIEYQEEEMDTNYK